MELPFRTVAATETRARSPRLLAGLGFVAGVLVTLGVQQLGLVPGSTGSEAGPVVDVSAAPPRAEALAPEAAPARVVQVQEPARRASEAVAGASGAARVEVTEGVLRRGEWLAAALRGRGIPDGAAVTIARELETLFDFRSARPGHRYRLLSEPDGTVVEFDYVVPGAEVLHLRLEDGRYRAWREDV